MDILTRKELQEKGWLVYMTGKSYQSHIHHTAIKMLDQFDLVANRMTTFKRGWIVLEPKVRRVENKISGIPFMNEETYDFIRFFFDESLDEEDVWRKVIERLNDCT